jgi:hypothetical protein
MAGEVSHEVRQRGHENRILIKGDWISADTWLGPLSVSEGAMTVMSKVIIK